MTQRNPGASTRAQSISNAMKRKWQDPDYRAKRAVSSERRKSDPKKTRYGIPNGYTRQEAQQMWDECRASAARDVTAMEARDSDPWHPYAREAMIAALTIMRSASNQRLRLKAARLFLEFTCPKPKRLRSVSISSAEEWIDALVCRD